MIPLYAARYWPFALAGIAAIAIIALVWSHFASDARTDRALKKLTGEAGTVLFRLRDAAENPKLEWDQAPGQIIALGESNKRLKGAIADQNATIDQWAREAADRRAEAEEWRKIADRAQAQRQGALKRLSAMSVTPGTRDDCMTLLREAEEALDLAREAGV